MNDNIKEQKSNLIKKNLDSLIDVYKEYHKVLHSEQTKRLEIESFKETKLQELEMQRKTLENYFNNVFMERNQTISELFSRMDQAIENENSTLVSQCIDGIVDIVKTSPINKAEQFLQDLNNPDIKKITF